LVGIGFEVLPVVRRIEAKFRNPAFGAIFSKLNVNSDKREAFISILRSKGRASFEIPVDVYDENGTHALTAVIEWFIAKKE
jgi:hypothetical protein